MLIEEILSKFDDGSQKSFFSFETFILNLLKFHIEQQEKIFVSIDNIRGFGDAFAEKGFDNFNGKTLIEIKYRLDRMPSKMLIDQLMHTFSNSDKINDTDNLIIINLKQVPSRYIERIVEEIKNVNNKLNVFIWGPEELGKIVNKHKKQATIIANSLFSLRLENAVTKETIDWKKERDARIEI